MMKRALLFVCVMALAFVIVSCNSTIDKPNSENPDATTTQPIITLSTADPIDTTTAPIDVTTEPVDITTSPIDITTAPVTTDTVELPAVTLPASTPELTPPEVTSFVYVGQRPIWVLDEVVHIEEVTKEDIYKGNLLLINENYPVRNEDELLESEMEKIYGQRILKDGKSIYGLAFGTDMQLDKDAIEAMNEMIAAYYYEAGSDFKYLTLYNSYRSSEEQQALYDKAYKTYAEDTPKYVSSAARSDYQAGLSILFKYGLDGTIYTMGDAQAKPALDWLKANAYKYGFVFRYPEDKSEITGMEASDSNKYQLRYVGKAHSYFMNEYNLCLEEYIPFLKTFKYGENHLLISFVGTQYESFYVEAIDDVTQIRIAKDAVFEVSGNNVDGYFVTIYRDLSVKEGQ